MSTEQMTVDERFKYLRLMRRRYEQALGRKARQELLDEMQRMTGLSRKHLIYRMHAPGPVRRSRSRERDRTYGPDLEAAVFVIADVLSWICPQRLKPVLVSTGDHLAKFGDLQMSPKVREQLAQISLSTLSRLVQRLHPEGGREAQWRKGRRPMTAVQAAVPIRVIPWQESEPGHFEVDLVHHGPQMEEGHLCTLQAVDVCTGWSECVPLSQADFSHVWQALEQLRARCPLPIWEMHSDNGPEFLNEALQTMFAQRVPAALFSRGRPGHKNDKRFVEEGNGSLIRAYLGEVPLWTLVQRQELVLLYQDLWLYHNFFQPVLRQISRTATLDAQGVCRIRRRQDEPRTPLQRLLEAHPPLSREVADRLRQRYEETNLRELKERIETRVTALKRSALEAVPSRRG